MIIGNGMLAKAFGAFENNSKILIFASGVSNSKETEEANYKREEQLLGKAISENEQATIVYFSSCSVYDDSVNKTSYILHKIKMEEQLKRHNKFYIFRLPQVVGETQSPTLVRTLFQAISEGKEIAVNKNSTRNLIAIADVFEIASYIINNNIYINEITNIATPYNEPVLDIVLMMAEISERRLKYKLLDIGSSYNINLDKMKKTSVFSDIFHKKYLHDLLSKYFNEQLSCHDK
jgi:nucleoside-diphosphate-sugar epimerase